MSDIIRLDVENPTHEHLHEARSDSQDFASANKAHFDKIASHNEDKRWVELATRFVSQLTKVGKSHC